MCKLVQDGWQCRMWSYSHLQSRWDPVLTCQLHIYSHSALEASHTEQLPLLHPDAPPSSAGTLPIASSTVRLQSLSIIAQGRLPMRHLQADAASWSASGGQRRSVVRVGVRVTACATAKAGRQTCWAPRRQACLHLRDAAPRGRRQRFPAGRSRQRAAQLAADHPADLTLLHVGPYAKHCRVL